MTQALHDGLSGRIRGDQKTPIAASLLHDIRAFDISAQLDVRPFHNPDDAKEAGRVLVEEADMVLCDMSRLNANVFFELGIRTALDRPAALVKDDQTT